MRKLKLIAFGLAILSFASVSAQKIEGKVFDKKSNSPISEGEITFYSTNGDKIATVYTLTDGTYSFEPKRISDIYKVATSAKNYTKAEVVINQMEKGVVANFGLTNTVESSNTLKVSDTAKTISSASANEAKYDNSTLSSFYYEFNSSYLTDSNKNSVDQIVAYMLNNKDARVRVHVYLDMRGNMKYDEWLAERRAERVINYLIMKGIPSSRLLKWVEKVSTNVAPKGSASRGGNAENRRCDFDII